MSKKQVSLWDCVPLVVLCACGDHSALEFQSDAAETAMLPALSHWAPSLCEPGSRPQIGTEHCVAIGTACPVDGWPASLPDDSVVLYVAPGASGSGTTKDDPMGSIVEALAGVSENGVIALSKGRYAESLVIDKPVQIVGACASETILVGSDESNIPMLEWQRVGGGLSNVTLTGEQPGIWAWGNLEPLQLSDVVVHETRSVGILFSGGSTGGTVRDVAVTQTRSALDSGWYGWGIGVYDGASVTMEEVYLHGNRDAGLSVAIAGTRVIANRLVVSETKGRNSGDQLARGIEVLQGAFLHGTDTFILGNTNMGIVVSGDDSDAEMHDLVVRDTRSSGSQMDFARGVFVSEKAHITLNRALIDGSEEMGVSVFGAGTQASLVDTTIRDGRGFKRNGRGGTGLHLQSRAKANTERLMIAANRMFGVWVSGGASWQGSHVVVRDTQQQSCTAFVPNACQNGYGDGIYNFGGNVELQHFILQNNARIGFGIYDPNDLVDSQGCFTEWQGDGFCDILNNTQVCGYDGGDCCESTCDLGVCDTELVTCVDPAACENTGECRPPDPCEDAWLGDGWCDPSNNRDACGYDGGDCCPSSCQSDLGYACGANGWMCTDPASCEVTGACEAPSCLTEWVGDGYCDLQNNQESCGFDGGDCCPSTCSSSDSFICGGGGWICVDPTSCEATGECESAPKCVAAWYGDGFCDPSNNDSRCGFDGGDCCPSTCQGNQEFQCGLNGFNCLDERSCERTGECAPANFALISYVPPEVELSIGSIEENDIGVNVQGDNLDWDSMKRDVHTLGNITIDLSYEALDTPDAKSGF